MLGLTICADQTPFHFSFHSHGHSCLVSGSVAVAGDACDGEPTLPPMLDVHQSASDPDHVQVNVLPGMDGQAQLSVDTAQTVSWDSGRAPSAMRMKAGGGKQSYGFKVTRTDSTRAHQVRVGLTLRDDQGRVKLTVQKEVNLDTDSSEAVSSGAAAPKSVLTTRSGRDGQPVMTSVPLDAPTPVQGRAKR